MKTVMITSSLLIIMCIGCKTQSDSRRISKILSNIEQKNKGTNSISYYTRYEQVNPTVEDSIFKVEGKVWLQRDNKDSIFGSVFHTRGIDRGGSFDYYYDGTKSYEIRHDDKTIKRFDPYKYENNANNPAKVRTALSPLIYELTDTNLAQTLQKIQDKYQNDLVVLGITTVNKPQVEKLMRINNLRYPNIFADKQIISDYDLKGRPTYFLIDKNGIIIEHTEGNLLKITTELEKLLL